jgi:hypothetical protein
LAVITDSLERFVYSGTVHSEKKEWIKFSVNKGNQDRFISDDKPDGIPSVLSFGAVISLQSDDVI